MNKISRRQFLRTGTAAGMLGAAVVSGATSASACFEPELALTCTQTALVEGYDWGPGVKATILTFDRLLDPRSVRAEDIASVVEHKESMDWGNIGGPHIVASAPRTVTAAYTCSKNGKKLEVPSKYVCLEMSCDPNTGNPFCYDFLVGMNTWCKPYELEINMKENSALATIFGQKVTAAVDPVVDHEDALIPQMKQFVTNGVFRGTDGKELTYGYYAPKGRKLPLVIWLHGAGEGGKDPSIAFLGNKASALLSDEFQQAMGGAAYVLLPQTPTFWLQYNEAGDWSNNPGVPSVYTQTLKELIDAFVAEHPQIDTNRILIGGCSNGGYMTVNMAIQYPGYFAAAYPICEAYKDSGITEEQLAVLKDLPMWFVYAENDTTVDPTIYEAPTLARLKAVDGKVHTSIFADVHDTTGLYKGTDGEPYQYAGHWSWLYFFNRECKDDITGEDLWTWLGQQSK